MQMIYSLAPLGVVVPLLDSMLILSGLCVYKIIKKYLNKHFTLYSIALRACICIIHSCICCSCRWDWERGEL